MQWQEVTEVVGAGLGAAVHYPLRRRRQLRQADRGLPGKPSQAAHQVMFGMDVYCIMYCCNSLYVLRNTF